MCHCLLLKPQRSLFLWKKMIVYWVKGFFPHFSEDPFSLFIDLLPSITVKLLPGDLFLMNSTWLKKEAQCGIIVSQQLPMTPCWLFMCPCVIMELRAIFMNLPVLSLLVCFSQIGTLFKTGTSRSSFPLKSLFANFAWMFINIRLNVGFQPNPLLPSMSSLYLK